MTNYGEITAVGAYQGEITLYIRQYFQEAVKPVAMYISYFRHLPRPGDVIEWDDKEVIIKPSKHEFFHYSFAYSTIYEDEVTPDYPIVLFKQHRYKVVDQMARVFEILDSAHEAENYGPFDHLKRAICWLVNYGLLVEIE